MNAANPERLTLDDDLNNSQSSSSDHSSMAEMAGLVDIANIDNGRF